MEFDLIEILRERTACERADVVCGIVDDAALLAPPAGHELAVSIDTLVEGVHFLPGTAPVDLGWKALAVNLSDLAAMGATPAWAILSLTLPQAERAFVTGFAEGFAQLARLYDVALVGGDVTQGPLAISVAVHGLVPAGQGLLRSGARLGDEIYVTGYLGDAAAALQCLDRNDADARALRERLERPSPRVRAGQVLRGLAHAAIDISDGLLSELHHISRASAVGVEVRADAVPQSGALRAVFDPVAAREFALVGGDAYELCFTAASCDAPRVRKALAEVGCEAFAIGRIVAGHDVRVLDVHGDVVETAQRGWEHFRT
jgi:thiamine-monophosphate kinase